jgi:two-component system sensor histidine kinase CiaH
MHMRRDRTQPSRGGDGTTLRHTRLRLALWSGVITFVVVLLLGSALHFVVARQLAQDSEAQLRARAAAMASDPFLTSMSILTGPADLTIAPGVEMPGLVFGGPLSGTFAGLLDPQELEGAALGVIQIDSSESGVPFVTGTPDEFQLDGISEGLIAAAAAGEGFVVVDLAGTPVRLLTMSVETEQGPLLAQVFSDRTAELRTLESLFLVLLVAVPLVAVAAGLAGWLYSGRALVPIRNALQRQRQFAADASHELRTPLTVLSGNLQALSVMDRSGPSGDEAIADAVAETDRMASLLDDLLVLARTDAEAFPMAITAMDLADEAAEAMGGLTARAAERSVELALDVEPGPMQGDPDRLRQLIVILVGNAIDHGASPGHIWLTVRPDEHRIRLTVADDGPGITPADRDHAFERFWRGHRGGAEGSGLGLPIAEWIVAAHSGNIAVEERPGGGARFEVSFPT